MIEVCLGCNKPTADRDCGCPAGTGWVPSPTEVIIDADPGDENDVQEARQLMGLEPMHFEGTPAIMCGLAETSGPYLGIDRSAFFELLNRR
jgi:hypothetical protein